mmetsp:Transcript_9607/g.21410  ORF Transcript_9607/g.21410 Transcript_9607/m.21410 type:complete len:214 (+) Transcript_9607:806-1447(+)
MAHCGARPAQSARPPAGAGLAVPAATRRSSTGPAVSFTSVPSTRSAATEESTGEPMAARAAAAAPCTLASGCSRSLGSTTTTSCRLRGAREQRSSSQTYSWSASSRGPSRRRCQRGASALVTSRSLFTVSTVQLRCASSSASWLPLARKIRTFRPLGTSRAARPRVKLPRASASLSQRPPKARRLRRRLRRRQLRGGRPEPEPIWLGSCMCWA